MQQVAQDQINFANFDIESKWLAKHGLYNKLKKDNPATNDNTLLQFMNTCQNTTMTLADSVANIISGYNFTNYSNANSLNSSLLPGVDIELRHKTVNQIMLAYLMQQRDSFNTQELFDLRQIAAECPFVYGKAVYIARTLLTNYDSTGTEYVSFCEQVNGNERIINNEYINTDTSNVTLYPNPNNGLMYLQFDNFNDAQVQFEIYDLTGKLLKITLASVSNKTVEVNASELTNGIYFFKAVVNSITLANGKVIIIK